MRTPYDSCDGCPYKNRMHLDKDIYGINGVPLFPEINGGNTLLVFQSPGINEWISGRPISSNNKKSAAYKIEKALSLVGKTRRDFDITNSIQCYTGKLPEDGTSKPRDKPVDNRAIEVCSNRLQDLISSNKYKKIVFFGQVAKKVASRIELPENTIMEYSAHPSARSASAKSIAEFL